MDTPETFAVEDGPQNDRAEAEQLHQLAQGVFGQIGYMNATAVETAARTPIERLAEAQLLMLEAIYRELRHGHDQVTAQTAALAEHVQALSEHADAMDKLGGRLLEHADALSRYRPRN